MSRVTLSQACSAATYGYGHPCRARRGDDPTRTGPTERPHVEAKPCDEGGQW
jgi:hypothetical protein